MAVDSKEKRLSFLNFGLPWWTTLPEADGAIDADDRLHLLGLYSGVAAGSVIAVTVVETETDSLRLTGRLVDTTRISFTTGLGATSYDTESQTENIDADGQPVAVTKVSLTTTP